MSSGVIGMPKWVAIAVTLSKFGLEVKAEVNLWRLYWAFIKPFSWEAGSSFWIDDSYSRYYLRRVASAIAIPWSIWACISAAFNLACSTVSSWSSLSSIRRLSSSDSESDSPSYSASDSASESASESDWESDSDSLSFSKVAFEPNCVCV